MACSFPLEWDRMYRMYSFVPRAPLSGSDYSLMRKHHDIHVENERRLVRALEERGVETRSEKKFERNQWKLQI